MADALTKNSTENIVGRQQVIKELAAVPEWRQTFSGIASLIKIETPAVTILKWLKKYRVFMPKIMHWLPLVFSGISGILLGLSFANMITPFPAILWMFLGLMITGKQLKNISIQNVT